MDLIWLGVATELRMKLSINFYSAILLALGSILLAGAHSPLATAQNDIGDMVFRIGVFDGSSMEFAKGTPNHPVNFAVGKSDPQKDWFDSQPAVWGSELGTQKQSVAKSPRTIEFSIDGTLAAS